MLKTIAIYWSVMEANLDKTLLESEGISTHLKDEQTVGVNPLFSQAIGGVKLQVHESDFDRAKEILEHFKSQPDLDVENEPIRCPHCDSTNLKKYTSAFSSIRGFLTWFVAFLFAVLPFRIDRVYECGECGEKFKAS